MTLIFVSTDVGGGAVGNNERYSLARIPLRWMIRECFNCDTGIVFDAHMLREVGLPVYRNPKLEEPVLAPLYSWKPEEPSRPFPPEHSPPTRSAILGKLVRPLRHAGKSYKLGPAPDALSKMTGTRGKTGLLPEEPVSEYEADLHDISTEEHDQLKAKALWMFLEMLPMRLKSSKAFKKGLKSGNHWV